MNGTLDKCLHQIDVFKTCRHEKWITQERIQIKQCMAQCNFQGAGFKHKNDECFYLIGKFVHVLKRQIERFCDSQIYMRCFCPNSTYCFILIWFNPRT